MKILFAGGGSGGPVSPLLAVAQKIKQGHPKAEFLLVGTKMGPEMQMAKAAGMDFVSITSAKLKRYFSLDNFLIPFLLLTGFVQSFKILNEFQPDCIFGTGSFVQVPIVWVAWFKRIPVVLHQQDLVPSLANRLCQACAKKITVTFPQNIKSFYSGIGLFYKNKKSEKVLVTGNPFRESLKQGTREQALKVFNLKNDLPVLLVIGGGTGAEFINKLIWDCLPQLSKTVQIIHVTGSGKGSNKPGIENYHQFEFINDMASAYAAADLVLCRAGLSTITELSNLKKLAIIIPMPNSHQQQNGIYLSVHRAAIVLEQPRVIPGVFTGLIRKLIFAQQLQEALKKNIFNVMQHGSSEKIAQIITSLVTKEL